MIENRSLYTKQPLSISAQIQLLKDRGLQIEDEKDAYRQLCCVSYYRLSAYFIPFEISRGSSHQFKKGAQFEQIIRLYRFDRSLRMLFFDAIERIETCFKAQIINQLSIFYGNGWWYEKEELFHDAQRHLQLLEEVDKEYHRSQEVFVKHYKQTYASPKRPPAWMYLELMTLGQLSRLYKNLKMSHPKKDIALHFGLPVTILESWIEAIAYVRNLCAHHCRLWNRRLIKKPMEPKNPSLKFPKNIKWDRIAAQIAIVKMLLTPTAQPRPFFELFLILLKEYPEINLSDMGFLPHWDKDTFWDLN